MNIPDHFSESLETQCFGLKILKFFDVDPDPGCGIFLTLDPGWKIGSRITYRDQNTHTHTSNSSKPTIKKRRSIIDLFYL
jgi:hypothetical protein